MKILYTLTLLVMAICVYGQVGINQSNPNQTLDVNGKIKIGTDTTSPTAGTLQFSTGNQDFEGYDGNGWISFTQQGAVIPTNAIPIIGSSTVPGGTNTSLSFYAMLSADTGVGSSTPPAGKIYVITGFEITDTAGATDFRFRIGPTTTSDGNPNTVRGLFVKQTAQHYKNYSNHPIFVIGNGEYLTVGLNATTVSAKAFGYMIDE